MFLPKEIFYEKDAWNYELGKKLLTEYKLKGIKLKEIENHNNIEINISNYLVNLNFNSYIYQA